MEVWQTPQWISQNDIGCTESKQLLVLQIVGRGDDVQFG